MHFVLSNSNVTSSEAVLQILPNIVLAYEEKTFWHNLWNTQIVDSLQCMCQDNHSFLVFLFPKLNKQNCTQFHSRIANALKQQK